MEEPIESALNNDDQLKVARLQDDVIQIVFNSINAVFHGGTAIWRCYGGKRFSEDIDLYIGKKSDIKKAINRIAQTELRINFNRERRGTLYYDIFNNETDLSLQIKVAKKKGVLISYEKVNGIKAEIYSLSPEILIGEKIAAYSDRKLIRDIYDILVLTKSVTDKAKTIGVLRPFLLDIQKPKDENVLKNLIYSGTIPSFDELVGYLKRWCAT